MSYRGHPAARRALIDTMVNTATSEYVLNDRTVPAGADPAVRISRGHAFLALRLAPPRLRSVAPDSESSRCTKP